jgi:hypothetical protein
MFLEVRILNELRGHFSEVRILKGLRLERRFGTGRRRRPAVCGAFELVFELTQVRVACW